MKILALIEINEDKLKEIIADEAKDAEMKDFTNDDVDLIQGFKEEMLWTTESGIFLKDCISVDDNYQLKSNDPQQAKIYKITDNPKVLDENDLIYQGSITINVGYDPSNLNLEQSKELYSEYVEALKETLKDNEGSSLDNADMVKVTSEPIDLGKRKDLSIF